MLESIVPETDRAVNPRTARTDDRPRLVRANGRAYWLSVVRACGHDEFVDAADDRADCSAREWAARADVPCAECRVAAWQAQRAGQPASLIQLQPKTSRASGNGGGGGSKRRPSTRKTRRPAHTSPLKALRDAVEFWSSVLDEVAAGRIQATPAQVAQWTACRNDLQRQLRALRGMKA